MRDRRRRRARLWCGAAAVAAIMLTSGCTGQRAAGPDDWALEPISFQSSFVGSGPEATPAGPPTDLSYGMHVLSADGAGGFWATSSGSWLHVGADGETLARFDTDPGAPVSRIGAMAPLSATELVVLQGDRAHVIATFTV